MTPEDASEKTDLAERHPDVVKQMVAKVTAWRESCRRSKSGNDYR